ncbi:MAG: mycofactocin system glycosyltransferase [Solirubrobacterales bacterium]|nr:mycofactocin system glycosyltransferase [Solirubrobacterales bacterium]
MPRPTVDVVVPFVGSADERRALVERMRGLDLGEGDTLTVVDNGAAGPEDPDPAVIHAPGRPTSYFARNAGARRGRAEWILFLDDDVLPPADLLERCFGEPLAERAGIVAGGVRDEAPDDPAALPLAARYAALRAPMSQENTLRHARGYAQTANAAFRRTAFEAVGGFDETPRSGGDADLCFRLADAGWELVYRPEALVLHRNRTTLRALLRQRARHGAGSAWLNRKHPGSMPAVETWGLIRMKLVELARHARHLRREAATMALMDVLVAGAYLAGRRMGNEPDPR